MLEFSGKHYAKNSAELVQSLFTPIAGRTYNGLYKKRKNGFLLLDATDAGSRRIRECYRDPKTYDVRLHCLAALGVGFGFEHCSNNIGETMAYINMGDTYTPTLIYWRGAYRVACWGDMIENPRNKFFD